MRSRSLVLTFAVSLLVPASAEAQDLLLNSFRDYLEPLRVQGGIPGLSVAVVGANEVLWEYAFGQQNLERALPTRTDTPFHLDGITQIVTAALVLRCVEDGRLSLDDPIGRFNRDAPDAKVTLREALSHTTTSVTGLQFKYQPERLDPLGSAVVACTGDSLPNVVSNLFDRLGMADSVPGPDAVQLLEADNILRAERYGHVLGRLATPYTIVRNQRPIPSRHPATSLTPSRGLISSVRDFARFDIELRNGVLVEPETLALAWKAPVNLSGEALPHGLGWFVQAYEGRSVVWQFGVSENASSSLVIIAPAHGLTLILMANSDGLAKPFGLETGDLMQSPFARLFLELFLR